MPGTDRIARNESSAAEGEMTMLKEPHEIWKLLPKKDWFERREDINKLISYPLTEYLSDLEQGIRNDDDADIRNAAMEVYRILGVKGFTSLEGLLQDNNHEVRLFAVNILCSIADCGTFPLLAEAMNDADVNVRMAVAEALGKIKDPRSIPLLERAFDDEPWVAMAAIDALGQIGGDEALKLLYRCLSMSGFQELAIAAIGKAGNQTSTKYLAGCLHHLQLFEHALKAIQEISERENIRPDSEIFMHHIAMLLALLQSEDPKTRKAAGLAISCCQNMGAQQRLIESMKDENLQEYAIDALLQAGKKAVCGIVDAMRSSVAPHRQILAKTLSMIGAYEALLQFSEDSDAEVRTEVALALRHVALPRADQILGAMLQDPNEEVRMSARRSLDSRGRVVEP